MIAKLKTYLSLILSGLVSLLAVIYFRSEAKRQKERAEHSKAKADEMKAAIDSVHKQYSQARKDQAKRKETEDAIKRDSFLDYFE